MLVREQVKIFSGGDTELVEKQFNEWLITKHEEKDQAPKLKGHPFVILHRDFVIRNYKGEETFALVVHYEHIFLEAHEVGRDRAGGRDLSANMVGRKLR